MRKLVSNILGDLPVTIIIKYVCGDHDATINNTSI